MSIIGYIPLIAFLCFFALQLWQPRRQPSINSPKRQLHNLILFVVNSVIMRLLIPASLISIALIAEREQFGFYYLVDWHLDWPTWISTLICVVILDFAIYWQHVATHHWPILWRMHKVHHADTEMDVTTAVRFHPLELILSLAYKGAVVALLGAPVIAVITFELLLFIGPAFNHSNLHVPKRLDRLLRWFIATPDVHRSHHSTKISEQNTNYGFFLIWWDRMFGTYTDEPEHGQQNMTIGLTADKDQCDRVDQMLTMPFK